MHSEPTAVLATFGAAMLGILFFGLAVFVVMVVASWKAASKAGYPGILALLLLVPFGGLVFMLVLGFGNWPVLRELQALRNSARTGGGVPPAAP